MHTKIYIQIQEESTFMESKKRLVVKSNVLIESKYKLTTREQKIILYLISQIRKDDKEFQTYKLSIKNFSKMLGLRGMPKYDEIKEITRDLMGKVVEIKDGNKIHQVSWLSYVVYNKDEGTIDLRFDPFLKPFLLHLKKEFTSYQLKNVVALKGSYSIRLYELLKQYENLKERTFAVDELRSLLGVGKSYKTYGNLKLRVLKPAKKELQEKTDISFNFEEIKKGRKVTKVRFLIFQKNMSCSGDDSQMALFNKEALSQDTNFLYKSINRITRQHGYSIDFHTVQRWEKQAISKWRDNTYNNLLSLIKEVNHKGDINNPIGYITSILKAKDDQFDKSENNHFLLVNEIKQLFKRTNELLPQFFVRKKVVEYLISKYHYPDHKAHEFFLEYQDLIMKSVEQYAEKNNK